MSSKEILIDSTMIANMENDVSSAKVDTQELAGEDAETTIAANANSTECFGACNNAVNAMNEALQNDAAKIANSSKAFSEFDTDMAGVFEK